MSVVSAVCLPHGQWPRWWPRVSREADSIKCIIIIIISNYFMEALSAFVKGDHQVICGSPQEKKKCIELITNLVAFESFKPSITFFIVKSIQCYCDSGLFLCFPRLLPDN